MTAAREAMLHDVHEEWAASTTEAPFIARSATEMRLTETVSDDEEHGDGIIGPRWKMELLGSVELTDATDDFDFVAGDLLGGSLGEFVYLTPDGEFRTDVWLSNQDEIALSAEVDPWEADSDKDGLTDGQEVYGLTIVSKLDTSNVRVTGDGTYDIEPDNPDSDGDGAIDGGGHYMVDNQRLGGTITDEDQWIDKGEVYGLPTDPGEPDVITLFVVTDHKFRAQHDDYRNYVRDIVSETNYHLQRAYKDDEDTTVYLGILEWESVFSDDNLANRSPKRMLLESMKPRSSWKTDETETDVRDRANVLAAFSGQPMGSQHNTDGAWEYIDEYADAYRSGRTIIVGTNDLTTNALDRYDLEYNLFQHELGHVLDADHPGDSNRVPNGTDGVMCKKSCIKEELIKYISLGVYPPLLIVKLISNPTDEWMLSTHEWSTENKKIMRNNICDVAVNHDPSKECNQ